MYKIWYTKYAAETQDDTNKWQREYNEFSVKYCESLIVGPQKVILKEILDL